METKTDITRFIVKYAEKFGSNEITNQENLKENIKSKFNFDIYLEVMQAIQDDLTSDKVNIADKAELKQLKSELFYIANQVYFSKFYKEVSLEEKVRADGFSFDVSIFKPLKRSVLFN